MYKIPKKKEGFLLTSLSRTILQDYQIRKSKKQKLSFIDLLKTHIPELTVQTGGVPTNRNIIVGDVEKAQMVLTAHYDTCARMLFPNFITPRNPLLAVLYGVVIALPMLVVCFSMRALMALLTDDFWIIYWACMASLFAMLFVMMAGPANKHTANDNTSGVITLCEIYVALSPQEREKVCFVFFDNEELGLLGSSYFRSQYKKQMKNKLLINFDCVSDGDHILMGLSRLARQEYGELITQSYQPRNDKQLLPEKLEKLYYPSDQNGFRCAVAVAALNKKKCIGYYMDKIHTDKDRVFDEENIHLLRDGTCRLISKLS